MKKKLTAIILTFVFCIPMHALAAPDIHEAGRKIIEKNSDAVITAMVVVELTSSYEGQSRKSQTKASTTATIISPDGLAITTLSSINPMEVFSSFRDMNFEGKIVDVKFRMPDGNDLEADVVLRDKDLDLALLKTKKKPEKPLTYVDFTDSSEAKQLDNSVLLSRLSAVAGRTLSARIANIMAVAEKPRKFYILGVESSYFHGGPAFGADGKAIGLVVLRKPISMGNSMSDFSKDMMTAIMPSDVIVNAAKQAEEALKAK